jgi:hypothetical protein
MLVQNWEDGRVILHVMLGATPEAERLPEDVDIKSDEVVVHHGYPTIT